MIERHIQKTEVATDVHEIDPDISEAAFDRVLGAIASDASDAVFDKAFDDFMAQQGENAPEPTKNAPAIIKEQPLNPLDF